MVVAPGRAMAPHECCNGTLCLGARRLLPKGMQPASAHPSHYVSQFILGRVARSRAEFSALTLAHHQWSACGQGAQYQSPLRVPGHPGSGRLLSRRILVIEPRSPPLGALVQRPHCRWPLVYQSNPGQVARSDRWGEPLAPGRRPRATPPPSWWPRTRPGSAATPSSTPLGRRPGCGPSRPDGPSSTRPTVGRPWWWTTPVPC